MSDQDYDLLVIGSGPAGQKAAIQGAKAGLRVAVVEREREVGGACVHRGTIPSKALQDLALQMARLRRSADALDCRLRDRLQVPTLTRRMSGVVQAHVGYMTEQLRRNRIERIHGRARFLSEGEVEVRAVDGSRRTLAARWFVIATGSRPRAPEHIPVDHEHVLDSDSILSMTYLPGRLTVLGGGVIATEYASIFSRLGVKVTMIDKSPRPLGFLDLEIVGKFLQSFRRGGGRYLGGRAIASVVADGFSSVVTTLEGGDRIESDKVLVALGRVADLAGLEVEAAGVGLTTRGHVAVDANHRTAVGHIYAVGDAIGPPALASQSMEQGRRAVRHALGLPPGPPPEQVPIGIYAVPELASVGLTEAEATVRHGSAVVGRADFSEIARGQISDIQDGLLKLVADASGTRLLGAHIVGEGATDLIHLAQMALSFGAGVGVFVQHTFNFPTLAEAYRVAALDVENQVRSGLLAAAGPAADEPAIVEPAVVVG